MKTKKHFMKRMRFFMSNAILRVLLRSTAQAQLRSLSTTPARCSTALAMDPAWRDKNYPKLGDRDIVGFGVNGDPSYQDMEDAPFPAIRFGKNTPEIMALKEKEKGDWHNLTLDEKKQLYRHSFRQTLSERYAPTGQWKVFLAMTLATVSGTFAIILFLHYFIYPPPRSTLTEEWRRDMVARMLKQNQGYIEGISSQYDFDKREWKK